MRGALFRIHQSLRTLLLCGRIFLVFLKAFVPSFLSPGVRRQRYVRSYRSCADAELNDLVAHLCVMNPVCVTLNKIEQRCGGGLKFELTSTVALCNQRTFMRTGLSSKKQFDGYR